MLNCEIDSRRIIRRLRYMRVSKLKSLFLLMFMSVVLMLTACDEITSRDELEHISTDDESPATSENRTEADTTSKPTEAATTVKKTEADTTVK